MAKITFPTATTLDSLSTFNDNFQKVADELNDKVLYRDNPEGETNTMENDLDMNQHRVFNLPEPINQNEAARLKDVQAAITGLVPANLIPFTPSENISSDTVQGAIQELDAEKASQADLDALEASIGGPNGAANIGYAGSNVAAILKDHEAYIVNSIAELKLVDPTKYTVVQTLGYYAKGGLGGGIYWYDSTDVTSADDNGLVIVGLASSRWKLVFDGFVTAEQFGVVGGGAGDDQPRLQGAINSLAAANIRQLHLTNPAGYRINSTIVQPARMTVIGQNQIIRCEGIAPVTLTPAWRVVYTDWSENTDRWAMQESMRSIRFQGHAASGDGVWTTNLIGVQTESFHLQINNITCVGFDRAFFPTISSGVVNGWLLWENKFKDCVAFYCRYGIFSDFSTAAGAAGAGMTYEGGVLGHCNFSIYNNCGEWTMFDVASDAPITAHVENNITAISGNEVGFMHWQNSRIEAGGTPGTSWILNSGVMRFKDCFFVERTGAEFVFTTAANASTIVDGGTWRSADGRYKAAGNGNITQRGVTPINITDGALFNTRTSGVLNNDMASGTTAWGFSGTVALGTVADAAFLFTGVALTIAPSVFPATVSSTKIELDRGASAYQCQFRITNPNPSNLTATFRQYNSDGVQINAQPVTIPASVSGLKMAIRGSRFPNSAYGILEFAFVAGQTATCRMSDVYVNQW